MASAAALSRPRFSTSTESVAVPAADDDGPVEGGELDRRTALRRESLLFPHPDALGVNPDHAPGRAGCEDCHQGGLRDAGGGTPGKPGAQGGSGVGRPRHR